jgi:Flp pilus assembly protein TadD
MYDNMLPVSEIPVQLRLANALVAAVKYIWKTFVPFGQSMLYPFPASVPAAHWMGSLFLLSLGSFLALRYMKKAPYYFFGWFWFLIALLPVSGLLQGGLWPALADRFAYFPLIGIFIIIGWTAERIYRPVGKPMKICLSGFAFAATLFFMTVTYGQIKTWQSSLSLFEQALIHAPDHYVVNLNYGKALFDNGRVEEAMQYYRKAVALEPRSPKAHRNLANAFMTQNKYEPAILEYRATLELLPATDPSIGQAHFALGDAYEKLKDFENASSEYSKAIQLKPDYIDAYNALGIVLAEQGKIEQAITLFQKALQLKPDDPLLRQNLHYAQKLLRKK